VLPAVLLLLLPAVMTAQVRMVLVSAPRQVTQVVVLAAAVVGLGSAAAVPSC
jgi:hypothetical protein